MLKELTDSGFYVVPPSERYFIPICNGDLDLETGTCAKCTANRCKGFWAGEGSDATRNDDTADTPPEVVVYMGRNESADYGTRMGGRVAMLAEQYQRQEELWNTTGEGVVSPLDNPEFIASLIRGGFDPERRGNIADTSMIGVKELSADCLFFSPIMIRIKYYEQSSVTTIALW